MFSELTENPDYYQYRLPNTLFEASFFILPVEVWSAKKVCSISATENAFEKI
jgi:hypothetical protein